MKIAWLGLGLITLVALVAAAEPRAENKAGRFFAVLEKGQKVSLKETAAGYQIGVMPGVELGVTVKDIGADFIVLEDLATITETRISIYAIKSITVTRLPKK